MIIKLLEQPIIAMHEAEIAGTVDGVIIKDNKVSGIYHRNMENHFTIPVESAIIGSDAVMIQDVKAMTMATQDVKSLKSMLDVYNISGKHLGCLREIEVDDQLVVQYIYTEYYKIEMSKIVNYGSVIVADLEEAEFEKTEAAIQETGSEILTEEEASEEDDSSEEEAAVSMEIGPEIKWNDESHKQKEKSLESSELSVVRSIHHNDEKDVIPGVDAKYAYLCGKQLLEGIDIEDIFYEKGTIISAELIKHAISNNVIVKVIVNAED
ncbi:MAG TPA: hypothetical protein VEB00_03890 [Clostridia bacterium]|nr:hypothetical protein [Clostridia bacterium]